MMTTLFLVYWRNCNENPFTLKLEFSNYLYKFNYSLIAKNNVTKDC